jgi:hypothetical protein
MFWPLACLIEGTGEQNEKEPKQKYRHLRFQPFGHGWNL